MRPLAGAVVGGGVDIAPGGSPIAFELLGDGRPISENVEHMTLNGKPLELHALDIKRIDNGVVVKEWQYANGAEIRRALAAK